MALGSLRAGAGLEGHGRRLAGAMVGRKLISRIPEKVFLTAVIVLAFLATILLFLPARR